MTRLSLFLSFAAFVAVAPGLAAELPAEIKQAGTLRLTINAVVTTLLHPQCSGRPMQVRLLREFSCPDLWITTGEAVAANFSRHEATDHRAVP